MSTDSIESRSSGNMMSILTTQTFDDDFKFFGGADRTSASFAKRDTTYFKLVPVENKKFKKGFQEFCTGSSYIGEWNAFGFCGQGAYIYPHGTEYEGRFNKVGQFHGLGTLTFPSRQKMHGVWKHGKLFEYAYIFNCGEELDENFLYCQMPDRRFHVEIQKYFGPTGMEYLTSLQPTRDLPSSCYDTVDGIYNPKYKYIMSHDCVYDDIAVYILAPQIESCRRRLSDEFLLKERVIQQIPTEDKIKWIQEHCRKAWDEPTGYKPELYENWNAGRKKESHKDHNHEYHKTSTPTFKEKEKQPPKLVSFIKKVRKPHTGRFSMFGGPSSRSVHS